MPSKAFDTFVKSCFSNEFDWAHDGLRRDALLALEGGELAQAQAMILAALASSTDTRPYEAAGVLRLEAAAPLLRERINQLRDVLEYKAQDMVSVAAWALYQIGDHATAIPAYLRVMRLTLSYAFASRSNLESLWLSLEPRLQGFRSTTAIMTTLLHITADEGATVAIDEEFAALESRQPPEPEIPEPPTPDSSQSGNYALALAERLVWVSRKEMRLPARLNHLRLTSVPIERIEAPWVRRKVVQQFEDRLAVEDGLKALLEAPNEELRELKAAIQHRLKVHEDRHVILLAGLFGVDAAQSELRGIAIRSGGYDAARAAVARQYADGTDAFPDVARTIRAAPTQLDRTEALSLLAHLEWTPDKVYALLMGVRDNDDAYVCTRVLDWLGERFARSEPAQALLADVKASCKDEWAQVEGWHVKRGLKRPSEETLRTFYETLDI